MKKTKNKTKNMKKEKGTLALTQIIILVIAIIAFSWMIGSEIGIVSSEYDFASYVSSIEPTKKLEGGGFFENLNLLPQKATAGISNSPSFLSVLGTVVGNAVVAAVTVAVIYAIAKTYASERNVEGIVTYAAIGGVSGTVVAGVLAAFGWNPGILIGAAGAILAYGVYMIVGYQTYSKETFTFLSELWQPASGVNNCNACNDFEIAGEKQCSEYLCHTYGRACQWVNEGSTYETCVESNQGDGAPPIINVTKEVYGEDVFSDNTKYNYISSAAGSKIVYTEEDGGPCVPVFSSLTIALKTNEEAECRVRFELDEPGEEKDEEEIFTLMEKMDEGPVSTLYHTLELPSIVTASQDALATAGYDLITDSYRFYIRCMDVQGNINEKDYLVSFCVQDTDMRPPEITGTNPESGSYVAFGTDTIENFQVYTNEPANCKWDTQPKSYNSMDNEFERCSENINDRISGFDLGCETDLTGIENGVENKIYIACMDYEGNKGNPEGIIIKGSWKLGIHDVKINGQENNTVIQDSVEQITVPIEIFTSGGAEGGKAKCSYSSDLTPPRSYSMFYNEGDKDYLTTNIEKFYLSDGEYKYFIECVDIAENTAETMISFTIDIDKSPPNIVRVYKDNEYLKIVTDEEAECVYSTFGEIYDMDTEGTLMSSSDGINHKADWSIENDFYIKCKDEHGNRPDEDKCSLIARPFEILQLLESE